MLRGKLRMREQSVAGLLFRRLWRRLYLGHPPASISRNAPGDRQMLQRSNFKIRLLVGCDGLEWDTSRFRGCERSTCKLCHSTAEDVMHFLLVCPALQSTREMLLSRAPPTLSAYTSSPNLLINYLLGTSWLEDLPTQKFAVNFTHRLFLARADLIIVQ